MDVIRIRALKPFTIFVPNFGMLVFNPGDVGPAPAVHARDHIEGGLAEEVEEDEGDGFTIEHLGFGRYRITGPGIEGEEITTGGKAVAEARVEELKEAVNGSPSTETGDEGDAGAGAASESSSDAPAD